MEQISNDMAKTHIPDTPEEMKVMINTLRVLKDMSKIPNENERKRRIRDCFRCFRWDIYQSIKNLAICCGSINAILNDYPTSYKERFYFFLDGFKVVAGYPNEIPSKELMLELEKKIAISILEEMQEESFLKKLFSFLNSSGSYMGKMIEIFLKADLLGQGRFHLGLLEKVFTIYCKNIENGKLRSTSVIFLLFTFCENKDFNAHRYRNEWISAVLERASQDKKMENLLYEIFYLLNLDYDIKIVPMSEFDSSHKESNFTAIFNKCDSKEALLPVVYCNIPDAYMEFMTKQIVKRYQDVTANIQRFYASYIKNATQLQLTAMAMWDEIMYSPHKALRDEEKDQILLKGDLFNEIGKIYKIAFCIEDLDFPEVKIHFFCQRAHIKYDYYGKLEFIEVEVESGEKRKVIELSLPINLRGWYKGIISFMIIDAYHSIVVKDKSKIEYKSPKSDCDTGSQAYYIASPETDIIRATYRRLPNLIRKDGMPYQARWKEDPARYDECMKRLKGKIPEGYTFLKQFERSVVKKSPDSNPENDGCLFCYKENDFLNLAPLE